MIAEENDSAPEVREFDLSIVAVGFERRCRYVVQKRALAAKVGIGLEFGFLAEGSYQSNRAFFAQRGYDFVSGLDTETPDLIERRVREAPRSGAVKSVFVDISSMSRQMIANVIIGLNAVARHEPLRIAAAYAPSKYSRSGEQAPIRAASPIKPALAGWSATPEKPLAAVFGLGAEQGLALGALQTLEPDKAWLFTPKGIDGRYDAAMLKANEHISDIFDVSQFDYDIVRPCATRGRLVHLLNSIDGYYRIVAVPFGPKIFSWLTLSTVVFDERRDVGVWAFSSKESAKVVDRRAEGPIIWHVMTATPTSREAAL